jgi:hypothetical protein
MNSACLWDLSLFAALLMLPLYTSSAFSFCYHGPSKSHPMNAGYASPFCCIAYLGMSSATWTPVLDLHFPFFCGTVPLVRLVVCSNAAMPGNPAKPWH